MNLQFIFRGTLGVLYVNNDLAFGFRMYNEKARRMGFFVSEGDLTVKDVHILTEKE